MTSTTPIEPIPTEAEIIRRIGFLRYQEIRSQHVRELPTHPAYWGPDYEPNEREGE